MKKFDYENSDVLPLSVIVPVYNVEKYLSRCLDSLLWQTKPVQEIICVDDGSTDRSGSILDSYAKQYAQITVVHKENGGVITARIAGLARVTCPYVASVDSDDFVELDTYESLMTIALREKADIVSSGFFRDYGTYRLEDRETIPAGVYRGEQLRWLLSHIIMLDRFFQVSLIASLCGKVCKTELLRQFQNTLDPRIILGEDMAVIFPAMLHSSCICVTGREYYHYCLRNDSVAGTKKGNEEERIALFRRTLKARFCEVKEKVPNIMLQYFFIATHISILRDASLVVSKQGDVLYPFGVIPKESKILLYGAGKFGNELKGYFDVHGYRIVAWADKAQNRKGVIAPEQIQNVDYDILLIGIIKANIAEEAVEDLQKLGVPPEKIRRIDAKLIREVAERELAGETKFFE